MGLSSFNAMRARLAAQQKAIHDAEVQEVKTQEVEEPTSLTDEIGGEVDPQPIEEVETTETDAEKIKKNTTKNKTKKGN